MYTNSSSIIRVPGKVTADRSLLVELENLVADILCFKSSKM